MILLVSPNGDVGDDGENEKCKTVQIYVLEISIIIPFSHLMSYSQDININMKNKTKSLTTINSFQGRGVRPRPLKDGFRAPLPS